MYYVRLKPSYLWNDSRTQSKGQRHLLIPGARKTENERKETREGRINNEESGLEKIIRKINQDNKKWLKSKNENHLRDPINFAP